MKAQYLNADWVVMVEASVRFCPGIPLTSAQRRALALYFHGRKADLAREMRLQVESILDCGDLANAPIPIGCKQPVKQHITTWTYS